MTEPHPKPQEQWKIVRRAVGMGEHEYAIFLNDEFFARTNDEYRANLIVGAFNYGERHSSAKSSEKVMECRQEVKDFAVLMEQKLRKNDHKKHWKNCNQEYLLTRLDEEVKELHDCFFFYSPGELNFLMDGQHEDRIPGEAVDVANFAMMLWDNFGDRELRQKERERP